MTYPNEPQDRPPRQSPVEPIGPGGPGGPMSDPYGPQDDVPSRGRGPGPESAQASRGGFGGLPFPHYTTRTRRGTQVTVAGCCLPLPIGCLTMCVSAGVMLAAHARRRLQER
ncbi:hypothetical protein [Piscicoccus intestinalis]|uniref:hypothetical protein n=1 Tax=Piscicoccus intestinalis TaxID=746033 RepID=UPI000838CB2E|nr:hypothetical protein [Piscicoccus intestinalis]